MNKYPRITFKAGLNILTILMGDMVSYLAYRILKYLRSFASDLNVADLKVFKIKKIIDLRGIIPQVLGILALSESEHISHHWFFCFKLLFDLSWTEHFCKLNPKVAFRLVKSIFAVLFNLFQKDAILSNDLGHQFEGFKLLSVSRKNGDFHVDGNDCKIVEMENTGATVTVASRELVARQNLVVSAEARV